MSELSNVEVKSTWVTRRCDIDAVEWRALAQPRVGDLLLCEVTNIGLHGRVETTTGARRKLYEGDRIVCALASRYATSLLEAVAEIEGDEIDMVTASGLCGRVVQRSKRASAPTRLRPLGQAFINGAPLNLRMCALGAPQDDGAPLGPDLQCVVVVGSAMDSGKTTACTSLINGLAAAARRVGAVKLTGSASARDLGSFRDAGAMPFLDFLDFGWGSTAGCTDTELHAIVDGAAAHLRAARVEWGVFEIADGLLQAETRSLLGSLAALLPGDLRIVLTARESLAAVAGVQLLQAMGLTVVAISGLITNSPLACREAELECGVACVPTSELGRRLAKDRL
ncbi:MAG TPA: DUF1611 domain-containing protein [Acidimicrobiia bacterium]|nr:DUF1611 domain-containing protein [Acidimicrobiia bacterium]